MILPACSACTRVMSLAYGQIGSLQNQPAFHRFPKTSKHTEKGNRWEALTA